ncbi:MAG TPA: GreA/GreB family elongation factor [Burkholderiales bacterium]|nr:GreA/GreB family elongation factor [Burkholderiales bacterium]
MTTLHELILSASDAEVLALMLGERRRESSLEVAAARELGDLLVEARLVPHEQLPADRVAMNSKVTYEEELDGERRSVILVHPIESDPARGRISVLSPIGLALLGRRPGALVDATLPGERVRTIRILEAVRNREALAA